MTVFHAVNYERLVHASLRMTRRSSSSPVHLQVLVGGAMQARGMLSRASETVYNLEQFCVFLIPRDSGLS